MRVRDQRKLKFYSKLNLLASITSVEASNYLMFLIPGINIESEEILDLDILSGCRESFYVMFSGLD